MPEKVKKKPNILMIVEDHVAFYGHKGIKTPHFDKLRECGVFFENTYCSAPLCMPSRKTMMTGLYPHSHGQRDNSYESSYKGQKTYLDFLRKEGYDTYYFGKWHAGVGKPEDLGAVGVSYPDYSNPYQQKEYREYIKEKNISPASMQVEINMCEKGWIDDVKEGDVYRFTRPLLNEAFGGTLVGPKESHEAFYVADMVCRELQKQKKKGDKPFMMRVDFWGPHQPYHPAQEYVDMYPPEEIEEYPSFRDPLKDKPKSYLFDTGRNTSEHKTLKIPNPMPWEKWQILFSRCYAQITMIDEAAGRILHKLQELGMDKDTMIIWTADHGDALGCHGGHFDKAFYMSEEVLRIPLAIAYPGVLPMGVCCEKFISNVDFAPTIVSAAGGKMEGTEGRNILELFENDAPDWRNSVMAETFGHLAPWEARAVRYGNYKYVWNKGDLEELYDLEDDPYELRNLAGEERFREIVKDIRKTFEKSL